MNDIALQKQNLHVRPRPSGQKRPCLAHRINGYASLGMNVSDALGSSPCQRQVLFSESYSWKFVARSASGSGRGAGDMRYASLVTFRGVFE
jgi:hypothetical protein